MNLKVLILFAVIVCVALFIGEAITYTVSWIINDYRP